MTVLQEAADQTIARVLEYGRSRMEQVGERVKNHLEIRENDYEEEDEFILVMEELNLREKELDISYEEWKSVWMLQKTKKRKSIEVF